VKETQKVDTPSPEAVEAVSTLAKIGGFLLGLFGMGATLAKFRIKREEKAAALAKEAEAALAAKVDRDMYERHEAANRLQAERHHTAILELYKRDDKLGEQMAEGLKEVNRNILDLTQTIGGVHTDILRSMGATDSRIATLEAKVGAK
jgi:hypothetical protein